MSENWVIRTPHTEQEREMDRLAIESLAETYRSQVPLALPVPGSVPDQVDLSVHLRYIRDQNAGAGCWGYSRLAVWDIMNEIACPYSPNLSMRIWLLFHYYLRPLDGYKTGIDPLRDLWLKEHGIFTPDGRFHKMETLDGAALPEFGFFQSFGNTTEGTELTAREYPYNWPIGPADQPWAWNGLWTVEGVNEANNYRLKPASFRITEQSLTSLKTEGVPDDVLEKLKGIKNQEVGDEERFLALLKTTIGDERTVKFKSLIMKHALKTNPTPIAISSENFVNALAQKKPIRLTIGEHVVAVVSYNKTSATFKYVNSGGDNWGQDGFGTLAFKGIDNKQVQVPPGWPGGGVVKAADIIEIHPPKPVPAARISFNHTNRSNVHLWLYAENSPLPRNKIWPQGWNENSRNLSYTVRLPSEFIWPPSANNRLVLELYDAAEYSNSGGQLVEFTAAFGEHVVGCSRLTNGPIGFGAREHVQFCIP
jgi:hypothetical protein